MAPAGCSATRHPCTHRAWIGSDTVLFNDIEKKTTGFFKRVWFTIKRWL
jgi:hypothetical protein